MTARSQVRGWATYYREGQWFYEDTDEPVKNGWKERPCGECGRKNTDDGHDSCLGELREVMNACCGHGTDEEAYVQFKDGTRVAGAAALIIAKHLKFMGH